MFCLRSCDSCARVVLYLSPFAGDLEGLVLLAAFRTQEVAVLLFCVSKRALQAGNWRNRFSSSLLKVGLGFDAWLWKAPCPPFLRPRAIQRADLQAGGAGCSGVCDYVKVLCNVVCCSLFNVTCGRSVHAQILWVIGY